MSMSRHDVKRLLIDALRAQPPAEPAEGEEAEQQPAQAGPSHAALNSAALLRAALGGAIGTINGQPPA